MTLAAHDEGAPRALALLPDVRRGELVVPALDDGTRLFALMDELLNDFECATPEDAGDSAWRSGDFVVGAMIEFKGRFSDGRLGRWTVCELREFMLTWFPNVVQTDDDVVADVPGCACAFLRFLARRDSLAGDALADLEATAHAADAELLELCDQAVRTGVADQVARHVFERGTRASGPGG